MRIITLNVNGIRSAARKGFYNWLARQDADFVCLQELKAQEHQLLDAVYQPEGYRCWYHCAKKKGYSGVAICTRTSAEAVTVGLGWDDFDGEARYMQIDHGTLSVASLYMPSGSSSAERQAAKFEFMDRFTEVLKSLRRKRREYIICGDWNIAHKQVDLKNWRSNQKNSGFLPEERAWMDWLYGEAGYVDAFRVVNQEPEQYTWWSNRGRAWEKNVGWRIDYQVVTPGLKDVVRAAQIYKEQRFSDHAPLIMDYDIPV